MMEPRSNSSGDESKSAYVISPQPWDGFKVSKHHYAVALARTGWQVYFIDPPRPFQFARGIECQPTEVDGIQRVSYSLPVPGWTKFHARPLFDREMRRHARRLTSVLGTPDLVWDFDNAYQFRDLRPFGATKSIFHLVDQGLKGMGDKHADSCVHLHPSFSDWAGYDSGRAIQVGHGVSRDFIEHCPAPTLRTARGHSIRFGMVGNLKAPWFHWRAVEEIARRHPSARFVLWGPHRDPREATGAEGRMLRSSQVELRGLQAPRQIAVGSGEIDLWLLPFEPSRIPGGPLNSHKVLEYLATGRPVVMSCLEAYKGSRLVDVVEQETPEAFADAVDHAISRMDSSDADAQGSIRRSYAVDRLYEKRLEQICTACGLWRAGKR